MSTKRSGWAPFIIAASGIVAIFFLGVISSALGLSQGWVAGLVIILIALYLWKGEGLFNKLFGGKGKK